MSEDAEKISNWFRDLQNRITSSLEEADGKEKFREDQWERPGGGGGRSRVIEQGSVIEKGGVNFSAVFGKTPEFMQQQNNSARLLSDRFFASGVSIVIHPQNPFVPIIHMNVRYFESADGESYWFGGGIDLTPHYVNLVDAAFFHGALKQTCDRHDGTYYPLFKKWADDYFFISHRREMRGIGGIFFDHLKPAKSEEKKEAIWEFVRDVGNTFVPVYTELIGRNKDREFGEEEKKWQRIRRGRYAEFNLVYDRGTRFGLETNGRTESILMSLPPVAEWIYDHHPSPGSEEEKTLEFLGKGRDWINGHIV
ncbi:MAG TPA: oxygen-dependent coproporphyrinogen oxidase [Bacteroidia bacterium]|nr:oxygen-dependent coproporphyrinogen oxidase [Bacteroidia bacterium]